MRYRNHQLNVPHTFASHLFLGHFNATTVTHDSAITYPLILPTVTLKVLHRTEDFLTKETIPLGLIGSIIDRLGTYHLTTRAL